MNSIFNFKLNSVISDKRMKIGNLSLMAAVFILSTMYWHFFSWYSLLAPFGTLIAGVFLTVTFFCYVNIKDVIRDPAFYLMAAADVIALIHLLIVRSGLGAILTIADFLLILYLADKVIFNKLEMLVSAGYVGFFFLYWTVDVKGYFKGYNTNYGGLVLISGFAFLMIFDMYWVKYIKNHRAKWIYILMLFVTAFLFALSYNIISWYRSRCALMGLIVFAVLFFIPGKVIGKKWLFFVMTFLGTAGSIIFSAVYVWLGIMKDTFTIRIFYKDILSGREEIWKELWEAYLKHPITGIGSSYVMKLEWMEGLFEVHNGLLDILFVHGLVPFVILLMFFIFKLLGIREKVCRDYLARTAMAGIFSMLVTAFMENYIIVAPYSILILMLFAIINGRADEG